MKSTKEIATEYRMVQWSEIMRRRMDSGLSIRAFCENEGFPPNRYFYWQRRLRASAVKSLLPTTSPPSPVPTGWSAVSASDEDAKPESAVLTIEIGKMRIAVNDATDAELLKKVCKALVSLC